MISVQADEEYMESWCIVFQGKGADYPRLTSNIALEKTAMAMAKHMAEEQGHRIIAVVRAMELEGVGRMGDFVIDMLHEGVISEGCARDVLGWPGDAIRAWMKARHGVYTYAEREDIPHD